VIRDGSRFLLRKRPDKGLLAGLYEFPGYEGSLNKKELAKAIAKDGLAPLRITALPSSKHVFSHVEWHMTAYEVTIENVDEVPMENAVLLTKKELQQRCREFVRKSSETFHAPAAYKITAEFTDQPDFVMDDIFTEQFLTRTATVPNGALDFDKKLKIVKTSSNFAMAETRKQELLVRTSQRSLSDSDRDMLSRRIISHFIALGGTEKLDGIYPGWPADPKSEPVKLASAVYKKMFGKLPGIYAIHAGLETGAFAKKNPALKIISFGPAEKDIHTERESLDLKKYSEFYQLLRFTVEQTAGKGK
jgi:di/tripeptidase